jgi:hypothetical protein
MVIGRDGYWSATAIPLSPNTAVTAAVVMNLDTKHDMKHDMGASLGDPTLQPHLGW